MICIDSYIVKWSTFTDSFLSKSLSAVFFIFLIAGAILGAITILEKLFTREKFFSNSLLHYALICAFISCFSLALFGYNLSKSFHYYQVETYVVKDYEVSLKYWIENYEILESTPNTITVRSRQWRDEYLELQGTDVDTDTISVDPINEPLGKENKK